MFCNYCGTQLLPSSDTCTKCGSHIQTISNETPPNQKDEVVRGKSRVSTLTLVICIIIFISIPVIIARIAGRTPQTTPRTPMQAAPNIAEQKVQTTSDEENTKKVFNPESAQVSAFVRCKVQIKDSLKAPSTASVDDYGFLTDPLQGHIFYLGKQTFRTYHRVDAENAFGARLRKTFTCDVRCLSNDDCYVLRIKED